MGYYIIRDISQVIISHDMAINRKLHLSLVRNSFLVLKIYPAFDSIFSLFLTRLQAFNARNKTRSSYQPINVNVNVHFPKLLSLLLFLRFSNKRDILNFRVVAMRDVELRKCLLKTYTYLVIFSPFRCLSIRKSAYINACLFSTAN